MNKRNTYTPEFKTSVVLEILKEEMTLSQIDQKYEVHQNILTKWKQEFLEHAQGAFKRGKTEAEKELRAEKDRRQELEKLVCQLTYEIDWLKKNLHNSASRSERLKMVDFTENKLTVRRQAELVTVN